MDVHFHYRWSHKRTSRIDQQPRLEKFAFLTNATDVTVYEFSKYLLPAITSDFPEQHAFLCDEALQDIG